MLIIPPTFVHLEVLFETTVAKLSLVFVTRSGFYLLGCVLGGLFFDRIGRKELQQSVILILRMIAVAISPFFSIFWFVATWGVFGLLTGYCETGNSLFVHLALMYRSKFEVFLLYVKTIIM